MPYYQTFFDFATGINTSIQVPPGTCEAIKTHVENITVAAGLKMVYIENYQPHWEAHEPATGINSEIASQLVREHNDWVHEFYLNLESWFKNPPEPFELFTPEFAKTIWYGLSQLRFPLRRWSAKYYIEEMQRLFLAMQNKRISEIIWATKKLTPKQAAAVIQLFANYIDDHSVSLQLPKGWEDELLPNDECRWCPTHGAIPEEDICSDKDNNLICPKCSQIL